MRIIDVLGFIAYPLVVINLALLLWYFSASFFFQIKNRVVVALMFLIYVVAIAWGLQQFYNIYRRYEVVFEGAEPTSTSFQFIILQFIIALGLSGINYLLYSKRTNMTIPLPGFKRRNQKNKEDVQ